ncbi:MAG: 4'-phosphopantetheinyl transferase family protein [Mucilaginibacter sp.]
MTSAGNDIVALSAINVARTKQPNFYSRIISSAENAFYQSELQNKLPFEHFVWLAWSVKESAYKYLKRFDNGLIFSPSKMRVVGLKPMAEYLEGTVQFGDQLLYFQSSINRDFIFSIVNDKADFSETYWDIKQIDTTDPAVQSGAVREFLLEKLGELFPDNNLQIAKNPYGWPVIINEEDELPIPASFTHHGHFVAYSFRLTHSLWKAHQHHAEVL